VISCTTRTYLEDQLCSRWSEWSAPTNKLQSAAKGKGARADTYGLASRADAYGAHNRWECLSQLPDITIPPQENQDTLFPSMQTWVFMLVTGHKHPSSWESRCPHGYSSMQRVIMTFSSKQLSPLPNQWTNESPGLYFVLPSRLVMKQMLKVVGWVIRNSTTNQSAKILQRDGVVLQEGTFVAQCNLGPGINFRWSR